MSENIQHAENLGTLIDTPNGAVAQFSIGGKKRAQAGSSSTARRTRRSRNAGGPSSGSLPDSELTVIPGASETS